MKKKTIQDCQKLAEKHNGKCLSKTYINNQVIMKWKCENIKHKPWFSDYNHIQQGTWCPECGGTLKLSIEDCKKEANKFGGKCLSEKYVNNQTIMIWKCKNSNHKIWKTCFMSIRRGTWCPECRNEKLSKERRFNVNTIKKNIEKYGFEWIGPKDEYKNVRSKLSLKKLECGHKFKRNYFNLINGKLTCPFCISFPGENICREIFNKTFIKDFIKVRSGTLKWLKTSKGNSLELDGYNEELKIAFEYGNHNNKSEWYNKDIKNRDKLKLKLCKKNNIKIFQIKEGNSHFIFEQIVKQSKLLGIKLIINKEPEIDLKNIYTSNSKLYWNKIISKAQLLGFEILSKDNGTGCKQRIIKKCKRGHIKTTTPDIIMRNEVGCRQCFNLELTLNMADKIIDWIKNNDKLPNSKSKNKNESSYGNWIIRWTEIKNNNEFIYPELLNKLKSHNLNHLLDRKKKV